MSRIAQEKAKLMKTLERFDNSVRVEDVVGDCEPSRRNNNTFLIHVLLEALCTVLEKNHGKRLNFFNTIYQVMLENKWLDKDIVLDNFLNIRREMAANFFQFVKQVHSTVNPENPMQDIPYIDFVDESSQSRPFRYKETFKEMKIIAKGAFGRVSQVQHKVDRNIYAVKKIVFNYKSDPDYNKVNREVRNIATLDHPNVVRYNDGWFEPYQKSDDKNNSEDSNSNSEYSSEESSSLNLAGSCARSQSYGDSSVDSLSKSFNRLSDSSPDVDDYIIFATEETHESSLRNKVLKGRFSETNYTKDRSVQSSNRSFQTTSSSELGSQRSAISDDSNSTADESSKNEENCNLKFGSLQIKAVLYIQMEFCNCDLRQWLDKRNAGNALPFVKEEIDIFRDILNGVAHIHSRSIIHRDLKPQNIFYSCKRNVLKIGDFGLATLGCDDPEPPGRSSTVYSSDLGTLPYAAPEQRRNHNYDTKVDMYSLGIILIELLLQFKTHMGLSRAIEEIVNSKIPLELEERWPDYVSLVQNLVKRNPNQRMSAKEVLKLSVISGDNEEQRIDQVYLSNEMKHLKTALSEVMNTVKLLTQRLDEQDQTTNNFRREVMNTVKLLTQRLDEQDQTTNNFGRDREVMNIGKLLTQRLDEQDQTINNFRQEVMNTVKLLTQKLDEQDQTINNIRQEINNSGMKQTI